jgi:hypothetical protein
VTEKSVDVTANDPVDVAVPAGAVTMIGAVTAAMGGMETSSCVLDTLTTIIWTPLIAAVICDALLGKFVPTIVISPPGDDVVGVKLEIVGGDDGAEEDGGFAEDD